MYDSEADFGPYLSISSRLKIYNFDIDIKTFPSYEELINFKIAPQVDFDSVKNKTNAIDSILQVEKITKDINKLINNFEQLYVKLGIIKNYLEYLEVLSGINLRNLLEQMKNMESILCNDYSEKGIIELEDIEKLKILRK